MDARHVGRVLRSIREHSGRTQADVAATARVSQGTVSRAERGQVGQLSIDVVGRIVSALDGALYLDIRYQGGTADRLIDRVHASLVDHVVRRLGSEWEVVVEYTFNEFGERGSVDVLGWHARTRTLLIIEVKSVFTDLQAMLASLGRKARLLPAIVRRERGWDALAVGRVVVAPGTTANRAVAQAHAAIFDAAAPARAFEVRAWLREPRGPIAGLWFIDTDAVPTLRTVGGRRRGARIARPTSGAGPEPAP